MKRKRSYKEGDVVELNSGGPPMTVTRLLGGERLECTWLGDDGESQRGTFAAVTVKPTAVRPS